MHKRASMTWHDVAQTTKLARASWALAAAMARLAPLLLALLCAWAALCAGADGGASAKGGSDAAPPAAAGAAGGVTWLVQLSDLHLSAHAWPERCVIAARF